MKTTGMIYQYRRSVVRDENDINSVNVFAKSREDAAIQARRLMKCRDTEMIDFVRMYTLGWNGKRGIKRHVG